ncbi:MAG TPA: HAD-IB family phosphatase [Nevskiaceae bacterium]|nr:HAD-IB family phosphatase [Nevskiaceae bacterium]
MNAFNPSAPRGFVLADQAKIARKLQRFLAAGPNKLQFVFDFDHTLTGSTDTTTWHLLHELLPEEGKQASRAMRNKYLALEAEGKLSAADSHAWSIGELGLHSQHGTAIRHVKQAAQAVTLRPGTHELFALCAKAQIPTVILSAGIKDIIELIAAEHNIHPTRIISIQLVVDDHGRITAWDQTSIIHPMNKHEQGARELSKIARQRPYTILVGDTIGDAGMVVGDENVLRIRVCEPGKETQRSSAAYLRQSFAAGYDMVAQKDLQPLASLTEWILG